jgi:hypothetical protein
VFLFHNKTAAAGLSAVKTIRRTDVEVADWQRQEGTGGAVRKGDMKGEGGSTDSSFVKSSFVKSTVPMKVSNFILLKPQFVLRSNDVRVPVQYVSFV